MRLLIILCLFLCGCKSIQYVPVESIKTQYIDRELKDSIHILDSVFIKEKNDTVFLTRWRIEYRDKLKVDSFIKIDSIRVPYPVERNLTKWEKLKIDIGVVSISFFIFAILVIIAMLIKWLKK